MKADPLVSLGFGVCAYRDILWSFLWTFCLYSFMLYPQMQIFNSGTAYAKLAQSLSYKEHGMLGNMGYSSVNCANMPIEVGSINVSCGFGQIGAVTQLGVSNPLDGNALDICVVNDLNRACVPNSSTIDQVVAAGVGQPSFTLTFTQNQLYANDEEASCITPDSRLFVQYTCIQTEPDLSTKFGQLALMEGLAIAISLLFLVQIRRLYQGGKIQQLEWDMATITAGDYTVEWMIKPETYNAWYEKKYLGEDGGKSKGLSIGYSMKEDLKHYLENMLTTEWKAKIADPEYKSRHDHAKKSKKSDNDTEAHKDMKEVVIADITFSFNNSKLIHLLKARGYAISR